MVIRDFPLHLFIVQTTTVWVHGTTVWVYQGQSLKKLLENNFKGPMFIRGSPLPFTIQTTTVWAYGTTV